MYSMYINVHGPREHQSLSGRARPFSSDLQRQAVPCDMFSGRNLRNVPQVCGWTGPLASSGSPSISVFEALSEPCQAMGHFTAPRVSAAAPAAASTPWRGRSPPPSPQRPGTELSGRAIIPTPEIRKFRQGHGELVLLLGVSIYIYIYWHGFWRYGCTDDLYVYKLLKKQRRGRKGSSRGACRILVLRRSTRKTPCLQDS